MADSGILLGAQATVQVPRQRIRQKMDMAMVNFGRRYPKLAYKFMQECEQRRKMQTRPTGAWTDDRGKHERDTHDYYLRPPMVFEWLEMSEIQSNLAPDCQCPCGIGRQRWWYDRDLIEEFLSVAPACRLSTHRGIPKREV